MSFILFLSSPALFAAQLECIEDGQSRFEGEMPEGTYEWEVFGINERQNQAFLIFPQEMNEAAFFQAFVQKTDGELTDYAFPLEVLEHPIAAGVMQVEFIVSNAELPGLLITVHYLDKGYMVCTDKMSYAYRIRPPSLTTE